MATVAAAQVVQTPGHFGGFGSDGGVFAVADDFQFEQQVQVTGLTWWGGYLNPPAEPDQFTIRIFSDDQGRPGTLLEEFLVRPASRETTGRFLNEPHDLYPEFEYAARLSTPWVAAAGETYWLSIVNPPRDSWLWAASDTGTHPGVQRSFEGEPWQPYFDNTAFALTAIPEPTSAMAVALCMVLVGFIRRNASRDPRSDSTR